MFVLCTSFLLVLSCGVSSGPLLFSITTFFGHTTKTVTSCVDAQTAQMVSFEILLLFMYCNYSKRHAYIMPKSTKMKQNQQCIIRYFITRRLSGPVFFVIIKHLNKS